jgi:hypothetical protein
MTHSCEPVHRTENAGWGGALLGRRRTPARECWALRDVDLGGTVGGVSAVYLEKRTRQRQCTSGFGSAERQGHLKWRRQPYESSVCRIERRDLLVTRRDHGRENVTRRSVSPTQ